MQSNEDTIVALATPIGSAGVAVIRVSGSKVLSIATSLTRQLLKPRYATYTPFYNAEQQVIDQGVAIYFAAPHSFTGEDILELQGHGGMVVVDEVIKAIIAQGARLAKPGEFSERAFLNNKIDLIQAEAIADLISASSTAAAASAIRSLQGEFSRKITMLVDLIIHLRMYVESAIDFIEEEIDFLAAYQIVEKIKFLLTEITLIQNQAKQGSILQEGITIVIAGRPNVGKSTLLNCLSGYDRAIVTEVAGTTRDVIREHIVMDGIPLHILDTAGLRFSEDKIEQEGIRRSFAEISQAHFIFFMTDDLQKDEILLNEVMQKAPLTAHILILLNKIDLTNESPTLQYKKEKVFISLSAKTGEGISLLKNHLRSLLGLQETNEGIFSARRRHLEALNNAHTFLENALKQTSHELLAEDLRLAQNVLSEITGEFTSDDLLGKIFSTFCVGK